MYTHSSCRIVELHGPSFKVCSNSFDCVLDTRTYFIRTSRLRYGPNSLAISTNIRIGIYLTILNESLHHEMQFKAIFEGVWRKEFENCKIEVKNNRGSEKKDTVLTKKKRVK